jgi:hypothetical protein
MAAWLRILCTITRCQTLKVDDSQTSKMSTCTLIDYYCHQHSTFLLCSYLGSFRQALDALGQAHMIDTMALSTVAGMSIFGRLGTKRLGTVISSTSFVD